MAAYLAAGARIAEELVTHARELRQGQRDGLLRDIRDYVTENATDMNMGLTAVARQFRLKPRETAEAFRAYYGESINDVIHTGPGQKGPGAAADNRYPGTGYCIGGGLLQPCHHVPRVYQCGGCGAGEASAEPPEGSEIRGRRILSRACPLPVR